MINIFKMPWKASKKPADLVLSREPQPLGRWNKSRSKSEISFIPCERLSSLNTSVENVFSFTKKLSFPFISFFLSFHLWRKSVPKAKTSSKLWVSFFPTPLRFCCINSSLFSFALSIAASFGLFSASQCACILQLLKMAFVKPSTDNSLALLLNSCVHFFISVKPF